MFCECGCGALTKMAPRTDTRKGWLKGQPMRFLAQHHRRTSPVEYVIDERGCWIWARSTAPNGYGLAWRAGRKIGAHVLVYEREVGPVPAGLEIDHTCAVPACVNPAHLEPVTHLENVRRAWARRDRPRARDAAGRFAAEIAA